jgi:hypothetical protein
MEIIKLGGFEIQMAHIKRPDIKNILPPIQKTISYGINAPNPHNTQAWKIKIISDSEMLFYVDEKRLLPMTDPPARQIHIGCGCFIETLSIGAAELGYETKVEYFPEGVYALKEIREKPVARISLFENKNIQRDVLFNYIYERQTNRKVYSGPLVTDEEFKEIKRMVGESAAQIIFFNQPDKMKPFLNIFIKAMEIEATTHHLWEETRIWMRWDEKERERKRDGLSVPQVGADGLKRFFLELYSNKGNPGRWFSNLTIKAGLSDFNRGINSAKGVVFLKTKTNNPIDWVKTGRTYARIHLAITRLGMYSHPYMQVTQEYTEASELQKKFHELLKVEETEKIQMAFRIGRGKKPYLSYRRHLHDFFVEN